MGRTPHAREVTIAGRRFAVGRDDVLAAVRGVEPEPIASHFVVIDARRYPPKQIIGAVTGPDRADFTTHQARRTLMRLGFQAGRRGAARASETTAGRAPGLADELRPHVGRWVAIRDGEVLHAASSPHDLVRWLTQHGQRADSTFRVPEDDAAATGLAPL